LTIYPPQQETSWLQQRIVQFLVWVRTLPRWARPPIIGAVLLFFLTAVRGVFLVAFHPGVRALVVFLVALAVASAAGAFAGLVFVLIRMPLKRLGVVGDLLTGITLSCVFLFGILVPAKYWFGDDTLQSHEDWVVASVVAVAVGVVVTVAYWVNVRRLKKG